MTAPPVSPAQGQAIREAAAWYTRLHDGTASAADVQAWERWHALSPLHREAWQQVEDICGHFAGLPGTLAANTLLTARASRRKVLTSLFALASAAPLAWLASRSDTGRTWLADLRTRTGERREFQVDGNRLLLDTASAVEVDHQRHLLTLRAGAVMVTAPNGDERAPLILRTREGEIRAPASRFTVRQHDGYTEVAVLDHEVQICPRATGLVKRPLLAGHHARFDEHRLQPAQLNDASTAAWVQGNLVALDQPLRVLLAELGRYRPGLLDCDERIAGLKVSGAFPLDDTDLALASLENAFPVRLQQRSRYWVTVVPR